MKEEVWGISEADKEGGASSSREEGIRASRPEVVA